MATIIPFYRPKDILDGQKAFAVDAKGRLSVTSQYDEKEAAKVVTFFQSHLEKMQENPLTVGAQEQGRVIQTIELYLKVLSTRYKDKLDKGLSACRSDPLLMGIAKLDRYVTSMKFSSLSSSRPLSADRVRQLFTTQVARDQLSKWLSEATHTANAHKLKKREHKIVHSEQAALAYLRHPKEVDFVLSSFLHKQIGRLNEHIEVDPTTLHHQIRFNGTLVNVEEVAKKFRIDPKGKLFSIEEGKRYFYCQDQGLREYDPENWTELPAFRRRKHSHPEDDYRLVIKTIINEGRDDKHSWIELKTPTHVYNVGYFWDDQNSLPGIQRFTTIPGKLHVIDKNEFLGHEEDVKKTVSRISKEQFERIKKQIEAFQNQSEPKMFNLINSSCSTWTAEVLEPLGIHIASKENITRFITGKHFAFKFLASTFFGKVERAFHRCLAVLRNVALYLLGGAKHRLPSEKFDHKRLPFRSFKDVFDVKAGLFDFPMRIREWQEAVEAQRKEKIDVIQASELSPEDKELALETVRYALPTDVRLPEPEATF